MAKLPATTDNLAREKEHIKFLDKAYAQKYSNLYLVKGDPILKNLAGNARYKALLRKMKLPET